MQLLMRPITIRHLDCICDPGYDHAFFAFVVIPQILAANVPDRIEKLIPKENGPANNGYILQSGIALSVMFALFFFIYSHNPCILKLELYLTC